MPDYTSTMKIDDNDFEELCALLGKEDVPTDPIEARIAVEKFVDLVELLAQPLPLPPMKEIPPTLPA